MSRRLLLLKVLLGVQLGLSLLAAFGRIFGDCGTCSREPGLPALLGILCYFALLVRAVAAGFTPDVLVGVLFGAGVHIGLVLQMLLYGPLCGLCLTAAAVSAAMVGVTFSLERVTLGRYAVVVPAAALLVTTGWTASIPFALKPAVNSQVRISIFTQPDCPYCDELQRSVMPGIEKEFGRRVVSEYHSADDLSSVRRTPTLILQLGRSSRVIEGLPTLERLRGVIRDLEASP